MTKAYDLATGGGGVDTTAFLTSSDLTGYLTDQSTLNPAKLDTNVSLPALDGSSLTGIAAGGETNSPYFNGQKASSQTIARNTMTTVTGFTQGEIDSDNAFDGTTFTVPSGKAGVYFFSASIVSDFGSIGNDGERILIAFKKNGTNNYMPENDFSKGSGYNIQRFTNTLTAVLSLAEGDTMEVSVYNKDGDASGSATVTGASFFMGFRIKE